MCLSFLPIMLVLLEAGLLGRLTRAPAKKNEFPNSVVTGEWEKAWWKKKSFRPLNRN
jgi:hypothetical protein